jgi:hypothetical protein
MVTLSDFRESRESFEHENNFYLSCDSSRIAKAFAQFRFVEKTKNITGEIIECGVFKGASFCRFAMFRHILGLHEKKLVGFDTFFDFPETSNEDDKELREEFMEIDGDRSISKEHLMEVLKNKNCENNVELVEGDINDTVPNFVRHNPSLNISLINLDVDVYEPTSTVLNYFFPLMSSGGIIILDNFNSFPGETRAVTEYCKENKIEVEQPIFPQTPHYIVKRV